MIITTNSLNNIETKITTPQIEGIEFINAVLDENESINEINASYNDIIATIEAGKLPIIVYNSNQRKEFEFISNISFNDPFFYVVLSISGLIFRAENATSNMTIPQVL